MARREPRASTTPKLLDRGHVLSRTTESPDAGPEISVVVPARDEEGNLGSLYESLARVLEDVAEGWEIIFVDDGSRDATWRIVLDIHSGEPRVRGLRLSRNFGHQRALIAGLSHARGRAVISMDADLQHPPEVIPELVARWREGARIVKTVRRDLEGSPLVRRLVSRTFYRVFSFLSGVEIPPGTADFRLMDREALADVLTFREQDLFLRGIIQWVGYPTATVEYRCEPRLSGESKYTLRRMLSFAWHGVSAFSIVPLRFAIVLGFVSSALAFLGVLYAILSKIWVGQTVPGWASTVAIVSFLFAVLFFFLGILGEYIGRILVEVRGRPRYLISETAETDSGGGGESRRTERGASS